MYATTAAKASIANIFSLQKLKIYKLNNNLKQAGGSFTVMFNPTQYEETFGVDIISQPLIDGSEYLYFQQLKDQTLSLDLTFDTSYVDEYPVIGFLRSLYSLTDRVEEFKKITGYSTSALGTAPNKLQLVWDELEYNCFLQKMTLKYTRFSASGSPTRANATAIFRAIPRIAPAQQSGQNSTTGNSGKDIAIQFG